MVSSTAEARLVSRAGSLLRDPSASVLGKLVIVLAMIYVVVPIDLIPDVPLDRLAR